MKKEIKQFSLKLASKVIRDSAVKEANSSCFFIGYQPKLPEDVMKLNKREHLL